MVWAPATGAGGAGALILYAALQKLGAGGFVFRGSPGRHPALLLAGVEGYLVLLLLITGTTM